MPALPPLPALPALPPVARRGEAEASYALLPHGLWAQGAPYDGLGGGVVEEPLAPGIN